MLIAKLRSPEPVGEMLPYTRWSQSIAFRVFLASLLKIQSTWNNLGVSQKWQNESAAFWSGRRKCREEGNGRSKTSRKKSRR